MDIKVNLDKIQETIWREKVKDFSIKDLQGWKDNIVWELDKIIVEQEEKIFPQYDIYLLNDIKNLLDNINFKEKEDLKWIKLTKEIYFTQT